MSPQKQEFPSALYMLKASAHQNYIAWYLHHFPSIHGLKVNSWVGLILSFHIKPATRWTAWNSLGSLPGSAMLFGTNSPGVTCNCAARPRFLSLDFPFVKWRQLNTYLACASKHIHVLSFNWGHELDSLSSTQKAWLKWIRCQTLESGGEHGELESRYPMRGTAVSGNNEAVFPTSILPFPALGNRHLGWDPHPQPSHTLCPWLVETNRKNPIHLALSVFQLFQAVQVYANPQMVLPKPQELVQSGPVSRKLRGLCWKIWDTRRLVPSQFYRMQ